jgi:dCTP deaminase
MILSDNKIIELQKEHPFIDPFIKENVGASSVDLTLLDEFLIPKTVYKVRMDEPYPYISRKAKEYLLPTGCFVLASTVEEVRISQELVGFVEGRSSIGRRGLFVENAGVIDSGFKGRITLELFNASSSGIVLEAGSRICQLVLMEAYRCVVPYGKRAGSKYMNQNTVTGSKLHFDLGVKDGRD